MSSGTYGKKSVPTTPALKRAVLEGNDDPTLVRCPTCRGKGGLTVFEAEALEAEAKRKDDTR